MASDSNVWHQVHAQREDGVAAMFLIRDVVPRADQPKIFVVELPYSVADVSGQPDATAYRRLSAFQEQWLEPACAALGWTFVAWKCEDGAFFLYLYGAGDPNALLEKLAPFDGELGFFNDVDADWSEYAALRELVDQAESGGADDDDDEDDDDDGDDDDGDPHDHEHHDHPHHDHDDHHHPHDHHHHDQVALAGSESELAVNEPAVDEHADDRVAAAPPARSSRNGKSRSIAAGSEAAAATHRPLPRAIPASDDESGTPRRKRAAAAAAPAKPTRRAAAKPAPRAAAKRAAAKPAPRAAAKRAAAKPAPRAAAKRAAAKPAPRATAKPAAKRPGAKPRRSR